MSLSVPARRRAAVHDEWTVALPAPAPEQEREQEACATLAAGGIGTRGVLEGRNGGSSPEVYVAGRFVPGAGTGLDATPELLPGPGWIDLVIGEHARGGTRTLDLRHGLLLRELPGDPSGRIVRFLSLARPGLAVLRAEGDADQVAPGPSPSTPPQLPPTVEVVREPAGDLVVCRGPGGWIATTVRTSTEERPGGRRVVERQALVRSGHGEPPAPDQLRAALVAAAEGGVDELLAEHRERWEERWRRADVVIDGDPSLQQAVRFSLFHLMASVPDVGEAAVGARGVSGEAYRGHVFWDADVFVLPFLAATHPPAARAMLAYRSARLPAAEVEAARRGHAGARFPWESADDGHDVTPSSFIGLDGVPVPVLTGAYQEHVTADVAWAAAHYVDWTDDRRVALGTGRRLLLATARYWRSRLELDDARWAHLRTVMGPDEYHAPVDDDAFTNAMARWNLRRAAAAVRRGDPPGLVREAVTWRHLANALVDGYLPGEGRHEQFEGYDRLDPLLVRDLAAPPVAADVLLGHERVAATQLIKQADVVMVHHLLPDAVPDGSAGRDLDHYLPRTAHGSSLSPGVHASVLARIGRPDEALGLLRTAARVDLDDLTGTTGGGLHLAAAGSVWQAIVYGYLGVWPRPDGTLRLDPHLPRAWSGLTVSLSFHGRLLRLHASHARLEVDCSAPVRLLLAGHRHLVEPPGRAFQRTEGTWRPRGGERRGPDPRRAR